MKNVYPRKNDGRVSVKILSTIRADRSRRSHQNREGHQRLPPTKRLCGDLCRWRFLLLQEDHTKDQIESNWVELNWIRKYLKFVWGYINAEFLRPRRHFSTFFDVYDILSTEIPIVAIFIICRDPRTVSFFSKLHSGLVIFQKDLARAKISRIVVGSLRNLNWIKCHRYWWEWCKDYNSLHCFPEICKIKLKWLMINQNYLQNFDGKLNLNTE